MAEKKLPDTATEVLKAAESELVTNEIKEQGGVIRGSTAAKVQVSKFLNIVQEKSSFQWYSYPSPLGHDPDFLGCAENICPGPSARASAICMYS